MSLRDQLQAVYDENGTLTPELVVETARPKNHPLHSTVFDKAPKEAAEAYYRARAHELIQSVKVVYREATDTTPAATIRAFHSVRGESGYVYEPAEVVAQDPMMRAILLRDMEREWKALKARFAQFSEFVAMIRDDPEVEVA